LQPWHLLLLVIAGRAQQDQQKTIDYLFAENEILRKKLGKKRILLTDAERRRLAVKGKTLGRRLLEQLATIVTPDTILRWHRTLIAEKWNYNDRKKPGRPAVSDEARELVLRLAKENPTWGHDRIQGALANLGHDISDTTVENILKAKGIEPAPDRKRDTSWSTFIKAHWEVLASVDFTTVEVWTTRGLLTYYLLFVMEIKTRRVHLAGITPNPTGAWMQQVAMNLTDNFDGFLNGKKYLQMDRDTKFTAEFRATIEQAGIECKLLPARSPNLNAHIERFMRSIKSEALSRIIFFGEGALRNATTEFLSHYHGERNHQGLENVIPFPGEEVGWTSGEIECEERLGGMLRYYRRRAA
jgi:putative transposase